MEHQESRRASTGGSLHHDFMAGLAVAVVALPLALGFAVTTGASPASGIATAVIAGVIAALVGGSNYQVSGPTGAMTVVLVPIVAAYGVKALIPVGIVAGALMVLAGLLRLGRWIERVPWSVMEGFTLGIALTIAFQQIPLAFATTKAEGENALIVAVRTIGDVAWSSATWGSLALVVLTLAVKFRWRAYAEKRHMRFHVPGSIIAISVVTLVSLGLDVARVGSLPAGNLFHFELSTAGLGLGAIFYAALSVALLGGIESLLSARMADAMVHRRDGVLTERHRPNRELLGQGLGTMAASMLGGMPATGAIARTSVNVHAGARTKWASAFHAFLILAFVLVLGPVISVIPTAGLAGVLLGTSWRIASPATIAESLRTTRGEQVTFLVTALSVVAIDLIWGIVIGVVAHLISGRLSQGASRAR